MDCLSFFAWQFILSLSQPTSLIIHHSPHSTPPHRLESMRAIQRRCALALRPVASTLCAPTLLPVARPVAAAPAVASARSVRALATAANSSASSSPSATGAAEPAASSSSGLLPSQTHIVLPQLSPRMERGSVARWLVREGEEIKPLQVFMHVQVRA